MPQTPEDTALAEYIIRPAKTAPIDWADPAWNAADRAHIAHFHPKGSDHRPATDVRLLYDACHLYIRYAVQDRYVKSVGQGWQAAVCRDSCAEAFLMPKPGSATPLGPYFNFETNCGGAMLAYYIEDSQRAPGGFVKFTKLQPVDFEQIKIQHSLPATTPVEISQPVEWFVQLAIPFSMLEKFTGPLGPLPGQRWRANFLKCADQCSHPHWGAWSDIGPKLDFHQPDRFGHLIFAE